MKGVSPYFQPGPLPEILTMQISDTARAEFEPLQKLSSGFVERSFALVITTAPRISTIVSVIGIHGCVWYVSKFEYALHASSSFVILKTMSNF